jgi:hypothetical protein
MKTILILLSTLTLTFLSYSQKKSLFEWPIVDESIDIYEAKKEGFAMSFNESNSYVYRGKVDLSELYSIESDIELGTSTVNYFYFFDIKKKKVTVLENRNMVYKYNKLKVKDKEGILVFKRKYRKNIIEIRVDLINNVFQISEYNKKLKINNVSVSLDIAFYPKK